MPHSSSGTKEFRVQISNSATGPWTTMVDSQLTYPIKYRPSSLCGIQGTCDNGRHNVPIEDFDVGTRLGRYIKFVCDSYHGLITCALHSIQVL